MRRILLIVCLLVCLPAAVGAQQRKSNKDMSVNEFTFKRLEQVQELMEEDKYDEALKLMLPLTTDKFLNDHEKALVWRTIAYLYASKEDYESSIAAFKTCLSLDALPEGAKTTTIFNMGQIALAAEKYDEAIRILEDWFKTTEEPSPQAYYTLSLAYTQKKQYRKALQNVNTAVKMRPDAPESWLQIKLANHYFLEQYKGMAHTLEMLLLRYPKKTYWVQLSAVYLQLNREKQALAVTELAYMQGFLNDSQIKNLSQLLMQAGVPYKAGKILDAEMKKGVVNQELQELRMLSSAWLRAKELERADEPLSKAAALDEDGGLYLQLAELRRSQGRWNEAADAVQKALKKGGLRDPGNAWMMLGIAQLNGKQLKGAKKSLNKARGFRNTRELATNWLAIVEQEQSREETRAALKKKREAREQSMK